MSEWRTSTWGDEISLEYGKAIRGYQNAVGAYRVYGTNGPVGHTDKALTDGPGVILGRKGAYRGVHFSPDPFFVIDTAYFVKPKSDDLDMRWLYYAIIHHKLGEIDDGSPIPSTTRAAVYVKEVDIPPLDEQRAMADVLSALDDKIELNRRMNETLEAMARAVFRDWFVDFGPTRAKMEGRAPYLSPTLWPLFPSHLTDQGIPEGWEAWPLSRLADHQRATVAPNSQPETLFEHYSIPAYDSGQSPAADYGESIKSNKTLVPANAVLLSKLNPEMPRVWIPDRPGKAPQVSSTEFLVYTPKLGISRHLLYGIFTDRTFRDLLLGMVTGTSKSHQRVQPKAVLSLDAVVGTSEIFAAFDELVSPMLERVIANRAGSRTLAQTRDLLLPKLLSGEIRLPDAGKAVGDAL